MKAVFDYQGTPQHLLITYAFAKTTKQHISRDYGIYLQDGHAV